MTTEVPLEDTNASVSSACSSAQLGNIPVSGALERIEKRYPPHTATVGVANASCPSIVTKKHVHRCCSEQLMAPSEGRYEGKLRMSARASP